MKKTNVLWIILDLIFLVIFNALFFVMGGTEHNLSVWISYGFIHFAYLLLILTPLLIRKGKSAAVFGFSLYSISSAYFLIEFVLGSIFILVASENYKSALLVQLIVAGIYGIMLISHMIANEHTADAEEKRQYEIDYVKKASARLEQMVDGVEDKTVKKKLEKVYDAIYSSPVKSHPNLHQMEMRILDEINELDDAILSGNTDTILSLANSLLRAMNERNMRLRSFN